MPIGVLIIHTNIIKENTVSNERDQYNSSKFTSLPEPHSHLSWGSGCVDYGKKNCSIYIHQSLFSYLPGLQSLILNMVEKIAYLIMLWCMTGMAGVVLISQVVFVVPVHRQPIPAQETQCLSIFTPIVQLLEMDFRQHIGKSLVGSKWIIDRFKSTFVVFRDACRSHANNCENYADRSTLADAGRNPLNHNIQLVQHSFGLKIAHNRLVLFCCCSCCCWFCLFVFFLVFVLLSFVVFCFCDLLLFCFVMLFLGIWFFFIE